jgi:hypothetical protein
MAVVVEKGVPIKTPLTISFSVEELDVLVAILGSIGGSPTHSPRKYMDSIYDCLFDAGYCSDNSFKPLLQGIMTFNNGGL